MKKIIANRRTGIFVLTACILTGVVTMSFQNNFYSPIVHYDSLSEDLNDTLPEKKSQNKLTMKEFDALVKNFDAEMNKATGEMSRIDTDKINAELNAGLKQINSDEIKIAIDKAMQEIDIAAIEKDVRDAMKNIDWENVSDEVKKSLSEAKATLQHIDMTEVKKGLDEARTAIEKSKTALSAIDLPKIMSTAKEGMKKAGESLRRQKAMFDAMQQDGLINQQKGFTILYKKGVLYVNGKKQPDDVTNKYRSYFDKEDYEITIEEEK